MFCSNQKLEILGMLEDKDVLKESVGLCLNGYHFIPKEYEIKNGNLIFYSFKNSNENEIKEVTVETILTIIEEYLESPEYKRGIQLTNNIYDGYDGSSKEGWLMYINCEGFLKTLEIKPEWCFYHK